MNEWCLSACHWSENCLCHLGSDMTEILLINGVRVHEHEGSGVDLRRLSWKSD
jgi:hypothetical protein